MEGYEWLESRPHAKTVVEETEHTLDLAAKFASFMRLQGLLEEVLGREPYHYELMPDAHRHAWSEAFSAAHDAITNGHGKKWTDLAAHICKAYETALQIPDAPEWADKMAKDQIYWEILTRHMANLIEWCGDDSAVDVIEAQMVAMMRDRIRS